jgi:hypothetical protein
MSNGIAEKQNEPLQILRLKAQRRLYDEVRSRKTIRIIGIILVNALWVVLSTLQWHNEIITICGSGLLVGIEFLLKEFWQSSVHKKAAYIQELFDCDVLQLKWNDNLHDLPLSADEVARWANRYNEKRYQKASLQDWYSKKVDTIPLVYGRLCCINSNIDWDVSLRRKCLRFFWTLILLFIGIVGLVTFLFGPGEANKFLIFFACITPIIRIVWDETVCNYKSIRNLKYIRNKIDYKWNEILSGKLAAEILEQAARDWQDAILRHRMESPVLPRRYYLRSRPKEEDDMNRSSGALADEIISALKLS